MLRNILGKTTEILFLEYLLEFGEPFTAQEAAKGAHVQARRLVAAIPKLLRYKLIKCINPEAPEGQRKYQYDDSKMFKSFLRIDFLEASSILDEKRKRMPKD